MQTHTISRIVRYIYTLCVNIQHVRPLDTNQYSKDNAKQTNTYHKWNCTMQTMSIWEQSDIVRHEQIHGVKLYVMNTHTYTVKLYDIDTYTVKLYYINTYTITLYGICIYHINISFINTHCVKIVCHKHNYIQYKYIGQCKIVWYKHIKYAIVCYEQIRYTYTQ